MGLFTTDCIREYPEGKTKRTYKCNTKYQGGTEWICLPCATANGGEYDAAGNSQWEDAGTLDDFGDIIKCAWCNKEKGRVVHPRYFGEDMKMPKPPEKSDMTIFSKEDGAGVFF